MNIFDYNDFLKDIKFHFSEAIEKFNLKVNLNLNSSDKPINNFVFLENENCIVCLDNISSFPYPDITLSFFIKVGVNLLEINQTQLRIYLNLSDESISNFYLYHQGLYGKLEDYEDTFYGSYRYGIKFSNDLLIQFFSLLLNGKIEMNKLIKMTNK